MFHSISVHHRIKKISSFSTKTYPDQWIGKTKLNTFLYLLNAFNSEVIHLKIGNTRNVFFLLFPSLPLNIFEILCFLLFDSKSCNAFYKEYFLCRIKMISMWISPCERAISLPISWIVWCFNEKRIFYLASHFPSNNSEFR